MSLAVRATALAEAVGQEIKALRQELSESGDTWTLGPIATLSEKYRNKAKAADSEALKILVLSDSTSDGFSGGLAGTSINWDDVWPLRLAELLRSQIRLPAGGRGWVPATTPTAPSGYNYRTTTLKPSNWNTLDEMNYSAGMPGGLWLNRGRVEGSQVWADEVEYQLSPGTTSVEVCLTGYGANVEITCQKAPFRRDYQTQNPDEVRWVTIADPGTSISFKASTGQGFGLFGLIEHIGDEFNGVQMMNMAIAGITAQQIYTWLQDSGRSMKRAIAHYQPDVVLIVAGSNDVGDANISPADTLNYLGGIAMEVTAVAPDVLPIFVMRNNPDPDYAALVNLVKNNAGSVGGMTIDLSQEPRLALNAGGIYIADNQHYSVSGDVMMAQIMGEQLKVQRSGGGGGLSEEEVEAIAASAIAANVPAVQALIDSTMANKPRRWSSEVIINSGALADGYNDNIGGVLVDSDIMLYQASFRIADPLGKVGGTGPLKIQWYAGSVTELETELITTTEIAVDQHDVIVTFATPMPYTINTVLRAKITRGNAVVTGPCHIQWRGRYTT